MLKLLAFLAAFLLFFHLAWPPFYAFPAQRPFQGEHWYDPYAGVDDLRGGLRANFHAHSRTWGGLLAGVDTVPEVRAAYRRAGYDVVGISNYQQIVPPDAGPGPYLPAYEHGFGLYKQHQTVIGVERVSWLEYPLGQSLRAKQHVLDSLEAQQGFVIINHPTRRGAYAAADFARLTGYHALELRSQKVTNRGTTEMWDAALRAGRPVWGACSDDGHDYGEAQAVGVGTLFVHARDASAAGVLSALRAGAFHSVWHKRGQPATVLSCRREEGVLTVECAAPAQEISFHTSARVRRWDDTATASLRLRPDDAYVRVEVHNELTTVFLNPSFRYSRDPLTLPRAERRSGVTWLARGGGGLALALLGFMLFGRSTSAARSDRNSSACDTDAPRARPHRGATP